MIKLSEKENTDNGEMKDMEKPSAKTIKDSDTKRRKGIISNNDKRMKRMKKRKRGR